MLYICNVNVAQDLRLAHEHLPLGRHAQSEKRDREVVYIIYNI